jgi:serine/threonine protein kinase
MGRKHSKRKVTKRRITKIRNTLRKGKKNKIAKRKIDKRKVANKLVKHKGKIINGYKIIKRLNTHKSSIKYGGDKEDYTPPSTEELVGEGGHGQVFLTKNSKDAKFYAMKIILFEEQDDRRNFLEEIEILKKIEGIKNVCHYKEHWEFERGKYGWTEPVGVIIMDYIDGVSFDKLLYKAEEAGKDVVSSLDLSIYIRQLSETIEKLHALGIYHNDIKPDNIMISDKQAYLIDFGCADENKPPPVAGNPSYRGHVVMEICGSWYYQPTDTHRINYDQYDTYSLILILYVFMDCKKTVNGLLYNLPRQSKDSEILKLLNTNTSNINITDNYIHLVKPLIEAWDNGIMENKWSAVTLSSKIMEDILNKLNLIGNILFNDKEYSGGAVRPGKERENPLMGDLSQRSLTLEPVVETPITNMTAKVSNPGRQKKRAQRSRRRTHEYKEYFKYYIENNDILIKYIEAEVTAAKNVPVLGYKTTRWVDTQVRSRWQKHASTALSQLLNNIYIMLFHKLYIICKKLQLQTNTNAYSMILDHESFIKEIESIKEQNSTDDSDPGERLRQVKQYYSPNLDGGVVVMKYDVVKIIDSSDPTSCSIQTLDGKEGTVPPSVLILGGGGAGEVAGSSPAAIKAKSLLKIKSIFNYDPIIDPIFIALPMCISNVGKTTSVINHRIRSNARFYYGFLLPPRMGDTWHEGCLKVIYYEDDMKLKIFEINAIIYYDDFNQKFKTFRQREYSDKLEIIDTESDIPTYPIIINVESIPDEQGGRLKSEIIQQQKIYAINEKKDKIVYEVNRLYQLEDQIKNIGRAFLQTTKDTIQSLEGKKQDIIKSLKYCADKTSDDYTNYCEVMINAFIYNELIRDKGYPHDLLEEAKTKYKTVHNKDPELVTVTELAQAVVDHVLISQANAKVKEKLRSLNISLSA